MEFSVRLDALMNLMGVTNSKLARYLQVDPSLISRWRNGSRKPTKDQRTIKKISDYMVSQVATKYHAEKLAELIGSPNISQLKENDIIERVFLWLKVIDNGTATQSITLNTDSEKFITPETTDAYAGAAGRKLVLKKLFENFNPNTPNTSIYFYSNDPVDILMQDAEVIAEALIENPDIFNNIGEIKIIVNDDSTSKEFEAYLTFLLPFLATGRLNIVQIPHYRKESFSNSILIVGDTLAAASHGFAEGSAFMTNIFTKSSFVLRLVEDFLRVFKRATPLHTTSWDINFFEILDDSLRLWITSKPFTYISNALPICSANSEIINTLVRKANLMHPDEEDLEAFIVRDYFKRYEQFLENQDTFILMPLYSLEEVRSGQARMTCLPQSINGEPLIDDSLYLDILKYLLNMLECHTHLTLKVIPQTKHEYALRIQKDNHSSLVRNTSPFVNYVSVAPVFTQGFISFFNNTLSAEALRDQREENIETLKQHIFMCEKEIGKK